MNSRVSQFLAQAVARGRSCSLVGVAQSGDDIRMDGVVTELDAGHCGLLNGQADECLEAAVVKSV